MPSSPKVSRREALQLGAATAAIGLLPLRVEGKPSETALQTFVPQDHKLDSATARRLFERGAPTHWKGDATKWIGMPIGGIGCGQVYLGGDGKLWMWDICHHPDSADMQNITAGVHYANPMAPHAQFDVSAFVAFEGRRIPLSREGFASVEFENRYPIGIVRYSDPKLPFSVQLEGFTPFVPLDEDASSLPLTVLSYSIRSTSKKKLRLALILESENPIGRYTKRRDEMVLLPRQCAFDSGAAAAEWISRAAPRQLGSSRPDRIVADFEGDDYGGWKVEGTAFGDRPMRKSELPERYKSANLVGNGFVNSHQSRHGEESVPADQHVGKLTSPPFQITHNFLNFWIGGGNHPDKCCLNVVIDGKIVATTTGRNSLQLRKESLDLKAYRGKTANLEIVDMETGGWGHITVDQIVLSDTPDRGDVPIEQAADFGSFAVGIHAAKGDFDAKIENDVALAHAAVELAPGQLWQATAVLAWSFPNYGGALDDAGLPNLGGKLRRRYAKRFGSAQEVVAEFFAHRERYEGQTRRWAQTWYDGTLPHYFLERALIPVDCLHTTTAHWFDNDRFYGYEGVYCCAGTCQHVWNYAQAAARLFPKLERSAREMADYGIGWQPDGTIWYRAEYHHIMAHDGQSGTILRTYREHTMASSSAFLKRNWPKVKKSIERLIQDDPNEDGLWEGEQYNTLDSAWWGKISWISSLYIGALRAGVEMAEEMGDSAFANRLRTIVKRGAESIVKATYNGEYFAMVRDPKHPESAGCGIGCHIDQVFGDSFLHMVGLPTNLPLKETRSALASIWKYNYAPDAGGYMKAMQSVIKGGRWYAMPGEPGLLMTTFPKGGAKESKGEGNPDWMVGYFNECMNGFEYQAAAHMIAEGMVAEGFAIVHALHQRYAAGKRNPYNEIECSDHYSRSMASYGAFLTACGFAYHGPKGTMRFAPKTPGARFKAAFTAAEGWGSFERNKGAKTYSAKLDVAYGSVRLTQLDVDAPNGWALKSVLLGGKRVGASAKAGVVTFAKSVRIKAGQALDVVFAPTA